LGGKLIRTVSFLGCTLPVSFFGGGKAPEGPGGGLYGLSAIGHWKISARPLESNVILAQRQKTGTAEAARFFGKNRKSIAFPAFTATGEAIVAGRTFFPWTGDVHGDLTTLKILVMKLVNGFLGLFSRGVLYKGKTAGTSGHFVEHKVD
jgi:hypothetical protein